MLDLSRRSRKAKPDAQLSIHHPEQPTDRPRLTQIHTERSIWVHLGNLWVFLRVGVWIEYQVLSGLRIARTGAASAPSRRIGSATIR